MVASFYEHDFGLPLHPARVMVALLLWVGAPESLPENILHIACFIMLCEAYLGIEPHWKMWKHLFNPRMSPDRG